MWKYLFSSCWPDSRSVKRAVHLCDSRDNFTVSLKAASPGRKWISGSDQRRHLAVCLIPSTPRCINSWDYSGFIKTRKQARVHPQFISKQWLEKQSEVLLLSTNRLFYTVTKSIKWQYTCFRTCFNITWDTILMRLMIWFAFTFTSRKTERLRN